MADQLISFKTAELANEKGFNLSTPKLYQVRLEGKFSLIESYHGYDSDIPAPTQSGLQKWLRDNKIHITVDYQPNVCDRAFNYSNINSYTFKINYNNKANNLMSIIEYGLTYDTYELALERALQQSLKIVNRWKE